MFFARHSEWERRGLGRSLRWQKLDDEDPVGVKGEGPGGKEMPLLVWLRDPELSSVWSILAMCTLW